MHVALQKILQGTFHDSVTFKNGLEIQGTISCCRAAKNISLIWFVVSVWFLKTIKLLFTSDICLLLSFILIQVLQPVVREVVMHLNVTRVTGSFRLMGMQRTEGGHQNSIKKPTQTAGEHANSTKTRPPRSET